MNAVTINQPRPALIIRLAGALAETSTPSLILCVPGKPPIPLTPRATDLPALLRESPAGTQLATPDGCTITLTENGCSIEHPGAPLVQALGPISR